MPDPKQHPLLAGGPTMGLMSPEKPRYETSAPGADAEDGGHAAFQSALTNMGLKFQPTRGHYDAPEKSYVIQGPSREQMTDLGKKFGQEAVIFAPGDQSHEFIYTNGPHDGKMHRGTGETQTWPSEPAESYWTELPGHGFVRLGFDFDKLHDLPAPGYKTYSVGDGAKPQPEMPDDRWSDTADRADWYNAD